MDQFWNARINMDASLVTAEVQRLLDKQCIASVHVGRNGSVQITGASGTLDLIELGWQTFFVKVHNEAELETSLQVDSPNSQPVPGSPQTDVANRWMDLSMYNGRPLRPDLSGLALEYRVLQVYTRDSGERTGELSFRIGGVGIRHSYRDG